MKKISFILIILFAINTSFSQNYIGKGKEQIIIQEQYILSNDSLESWTKDNIYIEAQYENKILIHDLDNFKTITCFFENDTCISFTIVYYNLNKNYVEGILTKKYNYSGNRNWVYNCGNKHIEFCLREELGNVFIIEACRFITKDGLWIEESKL